MPRGLGRKVVTDTLGETWGAGRGKAGPGKGGWWTVQKRGVELWREGRVNVVV